MKSIVVLFISILILSIECSAQSDISNSKYIFNPMYFNPANTGIKGEAEMVCSVKSGLMFSKEDILNKDIPNKEILSASTPLKRERWNVGMSMKHEHSFFARNLMMKPSLAYRLPINETSNISIGLSASYVRSKFKSLDSLFSNSLRDLNNQNLGTGIFYQGKLGYLGFSITDMYREQISLISREGEIIPVFIEDRKMAFNGGCSFISKNKTIVFRPSFSLTKITPAVYYDKTGLRYNSELNIEIEFYNKINIGASYRNADFLEDNVLESEDIDAWFGYKDNEKKLMLITNWNIQEQTLLNRLTVELLFGYQINSHKPAVHPLSGHFF